MEIVSYDANKLDEYLLECFKKHFKEGIRDFFLPAGGTPQNFYRLFRDSYEDLQALGFSDVRLWQVDEVLNGPKENCFEQFFKENLGPWHNHLIPIRSGGRIPNRPTVSFLGLGVNGHVAFHEPHMPENFSFGCVNLGKETLKYLDMPVGTWGVTYGLQTFLKSEKIYLMVKGEHKTKILYRFLNDDKSVPAVLLKKHSGLILLADHLALREAA